MPWDWKWLLWHAAPPLLGALLVWLKVHYGHRKIRLEIKGLLLKINNHDNDGEVETKP